MAVLILFMAMLAVMLMRVYLPVAGARSRGRPTRVISLSLIERALWQRGNIYAIGAVLLLTSATGVLSPAAEVPVAMIALGILLIPVRVVLTSEGVALNNVVYRPWHEFAGYSAERRGVRFVGGEGVRSFFVPMLPGKQRELLPAIRRHLRPAAPRKSQWWRSLRWVRFAAPVAVVVVIAASAVFVVRGTASAACPEGQTCPDRSGLETGNGSSLIDLAPGTITEDDYAAAQQDEPFAVQLADWVNQNRLASNFIWVLVTGYLVMFMQAGFALVETGFTRAKNAMHTMAMNFMVYALGMLGYYVAGFAFQFGGIGSVGVPNLGGLGTLNHEFTVSVAGVDWGIIGHDGFFLHGGGYDVGVATMFLFQMVFMDTAATIPTGAMCERWKWTAFIAYTPIISIIIYPIFGNWVWGGGWLSQLGAKGYGAGYLDFAGSGVVHAIGGWTGLAGAMVLGPRLGKYNKDGTSNAIPGHNLVIGLLGVFILAFGWFGFNPGSTLGASGAGNLRIGIVATTTMLASASGALGAMAYTWQVQGKPDPSMMANGMLAGLVAITAPSGFVSPASGVVIGLIAGVLVCASVAVLDRVLHIDDPVGAVSVHGVCGAWGQIALGIFADGTMNYNGLAPKGLLFGDGGQFAAQLIGAGVAFVWAFGVAWIFFKAFDLAVGMRVSPEEELAGLDVPELGTPGYQPDAEPYRQPIPATPGPRPASQPASGGGGGGG